MKKTWLTCLVIPAASAWLYGCGSTPVHYHTLVAPMAQSERSTTSASFALDVLPVTIPSQLNQTNLVLRRGDTRVDVVDTERWAAPFGDEVRTALSTELSRQLGTYDVSALSASTDRATVRVKVQLRRFDTWPGKTVELDATWRLTLAGNNSKPMVCETHLTGPVPREYDGIVRAQQALLRDLARIIGTDIRVALRNSSADCTPTLATR